MRLAASVLLLIIVGVAAFAPPTRQPAVVQAQSKPAPMAAAKAGAASIAVPAEVRGLAGDFVRIQADTAGQVQWYAPDAGLAVFPPDLLRDSRTAVVIARTNGRYRLVAWTAAGDVPSPPAVCVVVIGDAPPPGPEPGPNPGPVDPLVETFRLAFLSDGAGPDNVRALAHLVEVYRQGAAKARDSSVTTAAQFQAILGATARAVIGESIINTRRAVWAEIVKVLPSETTALDAATRDKLAAAMERVAKALEEVKP